MPKAQKHYRRKFRSQTSDNMDRWKAEQGRGREKRKIRREKIRRERVRRKKMQMREKVGKSRNTVFFQWFGAPEGRKVGSLKRRVRSQLARWEMKNCTPLWREAHLEVKMYKTMLGPLLEVEMSKKCTPLWREAHFQVKMYKTHQLRTTFTSWDVEEVHAVVARSTFGSQNVQNTPCSDHFWKLRCRKSARRCGAKHISKSKCTKHTSFGPLLQLRCRKSARRCGAKHISKWKCTKHHMFAPLLEVQMSLRRFASLHYITLHYTTLHYTTLHYTTLHNTTTTTTQLDYTPLHSTTLKFTTLHYTTLRSTTLHYIKLHYTPLHYITLHYAPQHYNYNCTTTLHYTPLH